ncbi:ProteinR1-like [Symbiodinium microadriaticum]|uniref:ProteinR1-like n=1 Tax=Symbiodinium microadriaticum TaxID=2951 RepID=A0A1Q9C1B7_SYMMI|nr:ProteinR1-like [Symbiodinium microadriaticum]
MHRLVIFGTWLVLAFSWLLFALFYLDNPHQHGGHRLPTYQICVSHCEAGCTERAEEELLVELFDWTCSEECAHWCEVSDSETRASRREPQVKYSRGRWAFYRFCYMEEFLSVLFSLLNGLPYLYYVAGGMHSEHWLGSVLKVSAAFHCITWMLSALFHARPTVFFEHLDYSGVILTCLVEFFTVLLRVADCRDGRACNMALSGGALLFGAYSVGMPILNFPWRVQQLISQGVLGVTAALWIWYGVRERHNPLTQHIAMPWAFLLVFCVLELVDLPPFDMPGPLYGWVDSHCLWHLVTIPINAWIVYGWILEGDAARNGKKGSERQCLHWRNAEQRAIIWTGIFLIVFSVAVVPTWLQSGQLCSQHTRCRRELRPSWLGSMDLSDPQWRAFREKLPLLVAVAVSTTLLRRACPRLKPVAAFLYCLVLHGLGSMIALCRPGVPLVVCFLELEFTKEAPSLSGWSLALCLLYVKDVRWAEISTPGLAGLHDWSLDDFVTSSPPSFKLCVLYGLRIIGLLLLQEFVLTLVPFFAILQTRMLDPFRTRSFASLLYAAINGLWLKFAVMWRFFRLWALFDGIQVTTFIGVLGGPTFLQSFAEVVTRSTNWWEAELNRATVSIGSNLHFERLIRKPH